MGAIISYRLIYVQRIFTKSIGDSMKHYEKPLGEKILEAVILTIAITGTAFMVYGFYQVLDVVFLRNHSSC